MIHWISEAIFPYYIKWNLFDDDKLIVFALIFENKIREGSSKDFKSPIYGTSAITSFELIFEDSVVVF